MKQMKGSNMFSDYMVASSVNRSIRSINNSPTSGVIHKQRSSYGPRLTLINKSRDQTSMSKSRNNNPQQQQSSQQQHNEQYIQKIFLLMLQTTRLQQIHQQTIKQSTQTTKQSFIIKQKQVSQYKESNQTLKIAIKTLQSSLIKCQQEKMKIKMTYQQKNSQLELQVKTIQMRLGQYEKLLQKLKRDKQQLQLQIERLTIQRAKSSSIRQSRTLLYQQQHKRQLQLTYQLNALKQELQRIKITINEQQQIIRKYKQQNQSLQHRQMQLLMANHQYANQFQQIKKRTNYQLVNIAINTDIGLKEIIKYDNIYAQHDQLRQKLSMLQYQLSQKHKQLSTQQNILVNQIKQKQQSIKQKQQQIKQKYLLIAQLKMNNQMMKQKLQKLNHHATQKQFWSSKKLQTLEDDMKQQIIKKQKEIQRLKLNNKQLQQQNIILKQYIQDQSNTLHIKQLQYSTQNIDLENRLKKTQRKLKTIQKTSSYLPQCNGNNKNGQNIYINNTSTNPQTRLFKSRSIQSTSFFSYNNVNNNTSSNRRSLIDVNLQNIVTSAVNLQGSNERALRLINKSQQKLISSCMSPIKSKRKVFVQLNKIKHNNKQQQDSNQISFQQGKTTTRYNNNHNNKNNTLPSKRNIQDNLKSSIHEYYGMVIDDGQS